VGSEMCIRDRYPTVVADVIEHIRQAGGAVVNDLTTDLLTINDEFTTSIVIARCQQRESGALRWLIRVDAGLRPDITVAIRMDAENRYPLDYYLLPSLDMTFEKLILAENNAFSLDTYRFNTLDYFIGMSERTRIPEAA